MMIELQTVHGDIKYINVDYIVAISEHIFKECNTLMILSSGEKVYVKDKCDEVIHQINSR